MESPAMAENSSIEWTDHTFNPWQGCTKVSPGCDNCYAEARQDKRLHVVQWGAGQPRKLTKTWGDPVKWNKAHDTFYAAHGRRQRVFCASLADVFDNEVDERWRCDLFALIEQTPNLDWLLLTKRIGNASSMLPWSACSTPWPNVLIGATIVNQEEADRDIPKLLATPAAVRFLSIEPMLAEVDLTRVDVDEDDGSDFGGWGHCEAMQSWHNVLAGEGWSAERHGTELRGAEISWRMPRIDWVIAGGESGPKARPMYRPWVVSLRDQCAAAGVPFLFKQWGEWLPGEEYTPELQERDSDLKQSRYECAQLEEHRGQIEWDIGRPLCFETGEEALFRVGKKAAGRSLYGVEHNGFPATQ
jgi:protein gp37